MDSEDIIEVISVVTAVVQTVSALSAAEKIKKKKKTSRTVWIRFWLKRRDQGKDVAELVLKELQYEDVETFYNFNRMYPRTYHHLLGLLRSKIEKQDTVMRQAIPAETRLLMTLRFLATGDSFRSLSCAFRVSCPAITSIIHEVVDAIISSLAEDYMKVRVNQDISCVTHLFTSNSQMPKTTDDWLRIAKEFNDLWNFPHCLGALGNGFENIIQTVCINIRWLSDGKHIAFRAKAADGSLYFNYKGFNSIVLLALVDANYNFLYVDIGCNGRANDASVFNASTLCKAMEQKQLNIPQDKELEENGEKMP